MSTVILIPAGVANVAPGEACAECDGVAVARVITHASYGVCAAHYAVDVAAVAVAKTLAARDAAEAPALAYPHSIRRAWRYQLARGAWRRAERQLTAARDAAPASIYA